MINIATIGTGQIVTQFIDALSSMEEYNLVAVYSRSKEKAKEFADKYGAKLHFSDLNALAACDKIDAVYIASPNKLHFEQSMLMLKNKKHVICEKPITTSKACVNELLSAAKVNNVIFMEAIIGLHTPMMKKLQNVLPKIGDVSFVRFEYLQRSSKYDSLKAGLLPNVFNPEFETGCMMDLGIYCVYPAVALFGECNQIKAEALKHPNGIDLCGSATLKYNDKIVQINSSKIANGNARSEIVGDKGSILIKMISRLSEVTIKLNGKDEETICKANPDINPMCYELKSFYNYITSPQTYAEEYAYVSDLCGKVSDTLQKIRHEYKLSF